MKSLGKTKPIERENRYSGFQWSKGKRCRDDFIWQGLLFEVLMIVRQKSTVTTEVSLKSVY